jgi:hypothetical protein
MAKKETRRIPMMVLNIVGEGKADIDIICNNDTFVAAVYKETVESIKDALSRKKQTAVLFELNKSDYYIEISKDQWKQALQTCLDRLVVDERYEECSEIKIVMDKIK